MVLTRRWPLQSAPVLHRLPRTLSKAILPTSVGDFEGIVRYDLADIVQNADLQDWQEIFVVLYTFAGADDFGGLAEQLGARLEF